MNIGKTENRLEYVDLIKGIGMLTIIFVHTGLVTVLPNWENYFGSFHIFLFFFVSGFLFSKEKTKHYEKYGQKLAVKLLIPYIFFSVINWYINKEMCGATWSQLVYNAAHANLAYGSIWFLPALFLCCIVSAYIIKVSRKDWHMILFALLACFMGYTLFARYNIEYLRSPQGLLCVLFFIAGFLFKKYVPQTPLKHEKLLGAGAILLGWGACRVNGIVHLSRMQLGFFPLTVFSALCTIVGLFLLFRFSKVSCNPVFAYITYIGRNSLFVLCTHSYIYSTLTRMYINTMAAEGILSEFHAVLLILFMVIQTMLILLWDGIKHSAARMLKQLHD